MHLSIRSVPTHPLGPDLPPPEAPPPVHPMSAILILKPDTLYAAILRQHLLAVYPVARIEAVATVAAAQEKLATARYDLLVTGVGPQLGGDVLDLLSACQGPASRVRRTLVIASPSDYRELSTLRLLGVPAVFDSTTESPEQFTAAVRAVADGKCYWSASILAFMQRSRATPNAIFALLTNFEQVVLSVIGDGCDDVVAAEELGVTVATVSAVRRGLHRKLGVQHRGELVRVAAQQGFIRFTPVGVERPGYGLLRASYHGRRTKPTAAAESAAAAGK